LFAVGFIFGLGFGAYQIYLVFRLFPFGLFRLFVHFVIIWIFVIIQMILLFPLASGLVLVTVTITISITTIIKIATWWSLIAIMPIAFVVLWLVVIWATTFNKPIFMVAILIPIVSFHRAVVVSRAIVETRMIVTSTIVSLIPTIFHGVQILAVDLENGCGYPHDHFLKDCVADLLVDVHGNHASFDVLPTE
jgi:hypothetical protein